MRDARSRRAPGDPAGLVLRNRRVGFAPQTPEIASCGRPKGLPLVHSGARPSCSGRILLVSRREVLVVIERR